MTKLTISKCSDWLGGKGIINVLTENYNVPWKDSVDGTILDLDYYGNHSGNKIISPLVEQLIDSTGLSEENMNKLAQLIYSKYGYNWSKLWEATQLEYNPIHNYDGDEEEKVTVKETGTDSVVGQGDGQSKTYGFNSTTAVDADESNTDTSNTETKDLTTETTRMYKKGGNLGVTTTQQMMTSEYEYRINYEFFIAVFKDVDKILVIESYGDIKIRPCDVIIQSSYTLPPATENSLGGIKVGDNLTITSDGRLSATGGGGTGAVESVNGKVGRVVLNANDVGAYSPSNQPPYPVTKVNNRTGNVTITASELGAYTSTNQPPYPVTKVNNKTGDVTITATELGAYTSTNQPPYPVRSVNGSTGDISITASDLGAYDADNQPPYPVTSVNGSTGDVTLNATDIYLSNTDSVEEAIDDINTNLTLIDVTDHFNLAQGPAVIAKKAYKIGNIVFFRVVIQTTINAYKSVQYANMTDLLPYDNLALDVCCTREGQMTVTADILTNGSIVIVNPNNANITGQPYIISGSYLTI